MRIPIVTTVICSTLSTFAFYQGFVALFSGTVHPDDEQANNNQDTKKSEQATVPAKPTIAKPESMTTVKKQSARAAQKAKQPGAANGPIASNNLPSISIPGTPTPRSASAIEEERLETSGRSAQTTSSVAPPETVATAQTSGGDSASPLPYMTSTAPLSDVKGHWAQSYIESLAAKGIVRGYIDGNFHPDDPVTANQFATMAEKAFTAPTVTYSDLQRSSRDRVPTRADAAALIYQALAKADPAPNVTAVQVSGAVPRPGIYAMPAKNQTDAADNELPTVTRAIQRAGGALTGADLRQVQIQRVGDTTARRVINVDVERMLETGDRSRDIVLQQGDKLYIPAATTATNPAQPRTLPTPEPAVSLVERSRNKL